MSKLSGLIVSAVACVIGCGTVSTGVQAAAPPDALKIIIGGTTYLDFTAANEQQQAISKLQFAPLLDGFKATLAEAGMNMDDLLYVTVYCPDLSLYDKFNGIYRGYFAKEFPARAFVGSGPLLRGGHFEMQAVAVKR